MSLRLASLALGVLALGSALVPAVSEACTCLPPSLTRSYFESTDTLLVRILDKTYDDEQVRYRARVLQTFDGCTEKGDVIALVTSRFEASCGILLAVGTEYLVTSNRRDDRHSSPYLINLCGYNRPADDLTAAQWHFLADREVYCDRTDETTCADGSEPLACLADPCEVADPCNEAEYCESNTCHDCEAEFYDANWKTVCLP
jgi:hypothetical protein